MLELILSHLIGIVERIDPKIAKSMLESLDKLQIETVKSKEKTESDLDHLLFTLAFLRDDINRPEFYAKVREGYNEVLSDVGYDRRFKVLQKLDKMSYPYVYPEK
jgi:hypothetical protein